jgi:hypothetical protein
LRTPAETGDSATLLLFVIHGEALLLEREKRRSSGTA